MSFLSLLVCVLTVAFTFKNVFAIDCYQCINCLKGKNLTSDWNRKCRETNMGDAYKTLVGAVLNNTAGRQMGITLADEFDKLGPVPGNCFKISSGDKAIRGCAALSAKSDCNENNGVSVCVCNEDGCNGTPEPALPSVTLSCFPVFFALLYA